MTRPIIPPRGIFVPTRLLEARINGPMLATAIKLLALTWGRPGGDTPELTWEFLSEYTGLKRSQLYGHLTQLASMDICAWISRRRGSLIVQFKPGYYSNSVVTDELSEKSDNLIRGVKELDLKREIYPPPDQYLSPKTVRKNGKPSEKSDSSNRLESEIRERLIGLGVFDACICQIEASGSSSEAVRDLIDEIIKRPGGWMAGVFVKTAQERSQNYRVPLLSRRDRFKIESRDIAFEDGDDERVALIDADLLSRGIVVQ